MKQVFQHGFHVGSQSKEGNTDRLDMLPESHKKFLVDYFIHQSPAADKTADQIRWVNANSSAVQKLYLSDPIDISALAKQLTAHPAQLSSLQPLLSRHGVMKQLLESQDGNRVIWEVLVQFGQHTYQANALKPIFDQPEFWEQLGLDAHADQRKLILDIFGSHGIWGHPEHELTLKQTGLNIDANIYAQLCRLLAHQEPAEAEKFLKANEAFKNASAILAEINPVLDQMTDAEKAKLYKFASKQKMKGLFDHMEEYHQEKCQAPLNCIDILVLLQEVPANDPARMERILNNPDVQSKLFKFEGFEMSNENHVTSLVLVAELPHFKPWLVKNSLLTRGFIDRLKSEPTLHDKSVIAKLVQDVDKSTGTRAANVEGLTLWAPSRNSRTSATFVQIEEVGKPVEEAGKPEARPDNVVSPMVVIGY